MKGKYILILASLAVSAIVSCTKEDASTPTKKPIYKVVSHRGGYSESSLPQCCIQGLVYSHTIGCYAAECDIVITKDGYALIAHPDDGKVNGLVPYQATLAEIRAAGKLANGENIPIMEDFVAWLTNPEKNTKGMKIWIDTKAWSNTDYTIDAINAAYKVIKDNNACKFCEFIIPNSGDLFSKVRNTDMCKEGLCYVGWMADSPEKLIDPSTFTATTWHQTKYTAFATGTTTPKYSVEQYLAAGVDLSIWCTSTSASEDTNLLKPMMQYYSNPHFKAFFVNYPSAAIKAIKAAGN